MSVLKSFSIPGLLIITLMSLFSCSGHRPANIGIIDNKLSNCPSSPNCVSSDATDNHKILPIKLAVDASDTWKNTKASVLKLPNTQIVTETHNYLHAECSSSVFGFVDDLELHLRPEDGIIAIRSASRLGYSDFGVNENRVNTLRNSLKTLGVAE